MQSFLYADKTYCVKRLRNRIRKAALTAALVGVLTFTAELMKREKK